MEGKQLELQVASSDIEFIDLSLTNMRTNIAWGEMDDKPADQLDCIYETAEESIRDAKIANSRYKHITGKEVLPRFEHAVRMGSNVLQEIDYIRHMQAEGIFGGEYNE